MSGSGAFRRKKPWPVLSVQDKLTILVSFVGGVFMLLGPPAWYVLYGQGLPVGGKITLILLYLLIVLLVVAYVRFFWRFYLRAWLQVFERLSKMQQHITLPRQHDAAGIADALCAVIDRYEDAYEQEYTAKLLQKQAELDSLQSQINPHFLYNTLESIRGQALEDGSQQTAEMIEVLSRLFRYTISQRGDLFTLDQELKSVDNYLKIQQYRFNNRFVAIKSYDENDLTLLRYKIPKLTLQPIIENAIYHGLEGRKEQGVIKIGIEKTQSRLILSIADNGVGIAPENLHALNEKLHTYTYKAETRKPGGHHTGIAIPNVNARIKLLYGQDYGVTVFSTLGIGTRVELTLPLLEATHAH